MDTFHATTIVSVRRGERVVIGGDGQVTLGNTVMKANARKVRRLGKGDVLARVRIQVPKRVNKKEKELLEQLQELGG